MEQFAILIGCTRQSLYNWERRDRLSPQSRMADLFMRLIREAHSRGQIDVLTFLASEAGNAGFGLRLSSKPRPVAPILTMARRVPLSRLSSEAYQPIALAADMEGEQEAVVLVTGDNKTIARLSFDYETAALNLTFLDPVPFVEFDAEVQFKDGQCQKGEHATIHDQEATLLSQTEHTEDDVAQVRLLPRESLPGS